MQDILHEVLPQRNTRRRHRANLTFKPIGIDYARQIYYKAESKKGLRV